MRLEKVGVSAAELGRHALFEGEHLISCSDECLPQSLDLDGGIVGIYIGWQTGSDVALVEPQNATDRRAGADADSVDAHIALTGRRWHESR